MELRILDEIAFLFVEQFDNHYGMLVDRSDVCRTDGAREQLPHCAECHENAAPPWDVE